MGLRSIVHNAIYDSSENRCKHSSNNKAQNISVSKQTMTDVMPPLHCSSHEADRRGWTSKKDKVYAFGKHVGPRTSLKVDDSPDAQGNLMLFSLPLCPSRYMKRVTCVFHDFSGRRRLIRFSTLSP